MKMERFSTSVLAIALTAGLFGCGDAFGPTDKRPEQPKKIMDKQIDPAHYENKRECVKKYSTGKNKGKCQTYKTVRKETDDKDWILVTVDGTAYDVDEDEWNSVQVGDYWPR